MEHFQNDDQAELEIVLLGVGGAFDAARGVANTGALLTVRGAGTETHRALIDCGHTCGAQLHRLGLSYADIDAVLLTHPHGDHMDGLEVMGFGTAFLGSAKTRLIAPAKLVREVWQALRPKMGRMRGPGGWSRRRASLETYFDVEAVDGDEVPLIDGVLSARFVPTPHVPLLPAYGILLRLGDGPVIRWSGDTTFDPDHAIFQDLKPDRGDRIFHDCSFMPPCASTVHTHLNDLRALPRGVRDAIVLVHHGREERKPRRYDGMVLGRPLQRFFFPLATRTGDERP